MLQVSRAVNTDLHAEEVAIQYAKSLGLTPFEISSRWSICKKCQEAIRNEPSALNPFTQKMNSNTTFNREALKKELSVLPQRSLIAFGASCCERMLPVHEAFCLLEKWGDHSVLRSALDAVWSHLASPTLQLQDFRKLTSLCKAQCPSTEDFGNAYVEGAIDAATSMTCLLDVCRQIDVKSATYIGEFAYHTVYVFLAIANDPETELHAGKPDFYNQIIGMPLALAELQKQQEDLLFLKAAPSLDSATLDALRKSSSICGVRPFHRGLLKK